MVRRMRWRGTWGMYLACLIGEVLLSELGFGRKCLAELIAHCCSVWVDARVVAQWLRERREKRGLERIEWHHIQKLQTLLAGLFPAL